MAEDVAEMGAEEARSGVDEYVGAVEGCAPSGVALAGSSSRLLGSSCFAIHAARSGP